MDHAEAAAHLDALLDGELPPDLAGAVRSHVDSCPRCGEAFAVRAALGRTLAGAVPAAPSEAFVRAVLGRLDAEPAAPPRWPVPALLAGLAAAGVLLVMGVAGTNRDALPADLLLDGDRNEAARLERVGPTGAMTPDQVLNLVMEG